MTPAETNPPRKNDTTSQKPNFIQAADNAYGTIKEKIISNELKPGTILKEIDLAQELGLSRTPIREAMKKLKHEGLVTLESYNRNVVASFTESDIVEIYGIRATLEGYATSLAAMNVTYSDIEAMKQVQDEMDNIDITKRDIVLWQHDFRNLNSEFHKIIWKASKSPRIEKLLESTFEIPINIPVSLFTNRKNFLTSSSWQHREIIKALEAKNPVWAEAQMRAHTLSVVGFTRHN